MFKPDNIRTIQARLPATGVLVNGASATSFELTHDTDGYELPRQMIIDHIAIAHVTSADAAVTSISELILYNRSTLLTQDKMHEDAWGDFTAATANRFDGTERPYRNLDEDSKIHGTVRVKTGATSAAVYLTITFHEI